MRSHRRLKNNIKHYIKYMKEDELAGDYKGKQFWKNKIKWVNDEIQERTKNKKNNAKLYKKAN